MTSQEYQSFCVLSNIMKEYSGIFLASVARHACCGTFMIFGIVVNIACRSQHEEYLLVTATGAFLFVAGFLITVNESRATQIVRSASSQMIQQLKKNESKYESKRANSFRPLETQFGWVMYTFDVPQFRNFMLYLFDKVVIFRLLYC